MSVGAFVRQGNLNLGSTIEATSTGLHASLSLHVRNPPDGGLLTIGQYNFSSSQLFPFSPASDALIRLRTRDLAGFTGPLAGDPPELEAIAGTVDIDQTTSPLSAELRGRLRNVRLERPLRTADGGWLYDGGVCVSLPTADFDTRVTVGGTCYNAVDCGDPAIRYCDPNQQMCATGHCAFGDAGPGLFCADQQAGGSAVYTLCNPLTATPCRTDQTCGFLDRNRGQLGFCVAAGTGSRGDACTTSDTTDSCRRGLVCSYVSPIARACTVACNAFSGGASPCTASERCRDQQCRQPAPEVDPAVVGAPCANAMYSKPCADDGTHYAGVCHTFFDGGAGSGGPGTGIVPRECRRACAVTADCGDAGLCDFTGACYPAR